MECLSFGQQENPPVIFDSVGRISSLMVIDRIPYLVNRPAVPHAPDNTILLERHGIRIGRNGLIQIEVPGQKIKEYAVYSDEIPVATIPNDTPPQCSPCQSQLSHGSSQLHGTMSIRAKLLCDTHGNSNLV